ncbi:DEAD/DEAH box helicase [Bacillus velezensis]|uniref:DEAD/DEAH box helicase n=1 Tax=Bacillus velezensis TaxID=492670 RepID=UPI003D7FD218
MSVFKNRIKSGSTTKTKKIINPSDLFKSLIHQEGYDYLRDNQKEFLQKWDENRNQRDIIGILNTGAGKTLIGQLMLLSKLHEGHGPAVYLCPDKQLVNQAVEQARIHNIPVVTIPQDPKQAAEFPLDFINSKAILITTFERLFNGKSIFGVEGFGSRSIQTIGSLVIDDAHSCIKKARQQCTIKINRNNPAYKKLFDLFEFALKEQGQGAVTAIKSGESTVARLVPYWVWRQQSENVNSILEELYSSNDPAVKYTWGLIGDEIPRSQCFISGTQIEITPLQLPIQKIPSFHNAKHRFILSATFNNNTELITELGIDKESVENPLEIENHGDAGERLIIAPKRYYPEITDNLMRPVISKYAEKNNVVVIVPDKKKSEEWAEYNPIIVDKDNILDATAKLRESRGNLMVFINRYDGIDLAGDACRILVLDGLPNAQTVRERYISIVREGSPFIDAQIAQSIEQGLGRAVRSGSDYCTVFILDTKLLNFIGIDSNRSFFSPATREQLNFGLGLFGDQKPESVEQSLAEIHDAVEACLSRDPEWRQYHKEMILNATSKNKSDSNYLLNIANIEKSALEKYRNDLNIEACTMIREAVNTYDKSLNEIDQAWYLQLGANILDNVDVTGAVDIQLKAKKLSSKVLKPISHTYSKLTKVKGKQAEVIVQWLQQFSNATDIVIAIENLYSNLTYSPHVKSAEFEKCIYEIGKFLGFASQMPEDEENDGPDNLWKLENGLNLIIEVKNNSTNNKISRSEIEQLLHSIQWHKDKYGNEQDFVPIMLHKASKCFGNAHPSDGTKVMDLNLLQEFKGALSQLAKSLSQKTPQSWTVKEVQTLLETYSLTYERIIGKFTVTLR